PRWQQRCYRRYLQELGFHYVEHKRDWRSWLARFPDTEEVTGSSPVSRTGLLSVIHADVAQLARAPPCQGGGRGFESRHPLCCCYEALVEKPKPLLHFTVFVPRALLTTSLRVQVCCFSSLEQDLM